MPTELTVADGWRLEVHDGALVRRTGHARKGHLWCVHGFGESGFSFRSLLATALAHDYELVAPDLPGFGESPPRHDCTTVAELGAALVGLVEAATPDVGIGLVAHSLGGPIAVDAAGSLGDRVTGLFAIECNLGEPGGFFTRQAMAYDDADAFKADFLERIYREAAGDEAMRRYLGSIQRADAATLWRLGRDCRRRCADDAVGHDYARLACPRLYYWGRKLTPAATVAFLDDHGLDHRCFGGGGHWPMLDTPEQTAADIAAFFAAI